MGVLGNFFKKKRNKLIALIIAGELLLIPISALGSKIEKIKIQGVDIRTQLTKEQLNQMGQAAYADIEKIKYENQVQIEDSKNIQFNFSIGYDNQENYLQSTTQEMTNFKVQLRTELLNQITMATNKQIVQAQLEVRKDIKDAKLIKDISTEIAKTFSQTPEFGFDNLKITIDSYSDMLGNPAKNLELSQKRGISSIPTVKQVVLKDILEQTLGFGLINPDQYITVNPRGVELPSQEVYEKIRQIFQSNNIQLNIPYKDLKNDSSLRLFHKLYLKLATNQRQAIKDLLQSNRRAQVNIQLAIKVKNNLFKIPIAKKTQIEEIVRGKIDEQPFLNRDKDGRIIPPISGGDSVISPNPTPSPITSTNSTIAKINAKKINQVLKDNPGFAPKITRNSNKNGFQVKRF